MHYRNGREAKNGDKIVSINGEGKIEAVGVLYGATPGPAVSIGPTNPRRAHGHLAAASKRPSCGDVGRLESQLRGSLAFDSQRARDCVRGHRADHR